MQTRITIACFERMITEQRYFTDNGVNYSKEKIMT